MPDAARVEATVHPPHRVFLIGPPGWCRDSLRAVVAQRQMDPAAQLQVVEDTLPAHLSVVWPRSTQRTRSPWPSLRLAVRRVLRAGLAVPHGEQAEVSQIHLAAAVQITARK